MYMFGHGICDHLIRIAIIEEIALPGMVAHIRLTNKRREKTDKEVTVDLSFLTTFRDHRVQLP